VDFFFIDEVESLRAEFEKAWLLVKTIRRQDESPNRVPERQSAIPPRAQRNAFRRDVRQQSRSLALGNPRLTEIAQVHGCFSSQSF